MRVEKTLGPILSIFGLLFGPQVTNKCVNIGPRVASWLPKFHDEHLLVTWGHIEKFFFPIKALTLLV